MSFPLGLFLFTKNKIIAHSYNQTRTLCDPSAHAEILALREGARIIGNYRLNECDLYVSLEPCTMCAGAISHARIKRLYYALEDPKGGAVSNNIHFFDQKIVFINLKYIILFMKKKHIKNN